MGGSSPNNGQPMFGSADQSANFPQFNQGTSTPFAPATNTDSVPGTSNAANGAIGTSLPQGMSGLGGIPTQFTPQVSGGSTFTPPTTSQTQAGNQPQQQGSMNLFGGFNQNNNNQLPPNAQALIMQLMRGF